MQNGERVLKRAEHAWDAITSIAISAGALAYDDRRGELNYNEDAAADRQVFAITFRDWAAGEIEGTPETLIATIKEVLYYYDS